jgi:hypothetical protein
MNNLINHIKNNSKANSIEEKNNDFSLTDQKTTLNLTNKDKVFAIKIDKFYKLLFSQTQCDFLVYKINKTATFIELKGYYPIEEKIAYEQLKNTILHFNQHLEKTKKFAIIASIGFVGKIKDNKNSRKFIKETKAMLFEINATKQNYNLDKNQPEPRNIQYYAK